MQPVTMEDVKRVLGEKFQEGVEYLIETERGAHARVMSGTHTTVGRLEDTPDNAPMVIMAPQEKKEKKRWPLLGRR